jgi:Flp pilus assembly protein TadB
VSAAISWRRGVNFLLVEAWDTRLRALGLPKSLRQGALLTTGVHPRWLVLTTNALAFYMPLLQGLFLAVLGFFAVVDAWLLFRLAVWAARRRRRAA